MSRRVLLVAGARPNFMKIAPVHRALAERGFELVLVHTGQHYDEAMSRLFFVELGIPEPDINLEVGSASHAVQTAEIMKSFEPVLDDAAPDMVMVVGDVNSTVACSLVTKKKERIALSHVEAGLRSGDRTMPEEINRIVTDSLSDLLFTTERSGDENLRREGIPGERVRFVGNVMIDTLRRHLDRARGSGAIERHGLESGRYVLVTLHRPANVDVPEIFDPMMDVVAELAGERTVLFPVHPRTRPAVHRWSGARSEVPGGLRLIEPVGYLEFVHLMSEAELVLTDSGGIQEETTVLGVPCLTLRENTERPVTITEGTNVLVGRDPVRIRSEALRILAEGPRTSRSPEGWDGRAAERIADTLESWDWVAR